MSHRLLSTIALTTMLWAGNVLAQDAAKFSGTWNKDPKRRGSPAQSADSSAQSPVQLVIRLSPNDVRIERHRVNGTVDSITYIFDREGIPTSAAPAPAASEARLAERTGTAGTAAPDTKAATGTVVNDARAEWKDGRLVLKTVFIVKGQTVTTRETLSLSPAGELAVETLLAVQHGYESTEASRGAKDVYVRQ